MSCSRLWLLPSLILAFCCGSSAGLSWSVPAASGVLPVATGRTDATTEEPSPDWPEPTRAPVGAPNVVLILLDDIGFADTSTFGGLAETPRLDRLAARGLRYINFNTAALCSPTRAALLSGRNHHRVGFGTVAETAAGYPGYNSVWPDGAASVAEVLNQHGYSTAVFGKWHNTPDWEISAAGPFDRWPTGRGFEYFYGFMGGMENQWEPSMLYRNTLPVDAPATSRQHYHLTTDITDEAIRWLAKHEARVLGKPYFLYFAPGAVHSPHHVPREWIDRYRGKFDQGWDRLNAEIFKRQKRLGVIPKNTQLTVRPKEVPGWSSLSDNQKKLYARQMEVYAGFVSHTDYEIGRLLDWIRSSTGGDNTLVLWIVGDNGATNGATGSASGTATVAEQLRRADQLGGPEFPFNVYSLGWAWAGSTPFQYWKGVASHLGGVRDPMVVSWPAKIKDLGGVRSQFTHVTDIAATLYDVIGISPPRYVNGIEQLPLDGVSFAPTFRDASVRSAHRRQYFEMWGNRAIYDNDWIAAARHRESWVNNDYSADSWELYQVSKDFSEAHNLARQEPEKLQQLVSLFDEEARKNNVYPLGAAIVQSAKPSLTKGRWELIYPGSEHHVSVADAPAFDRVSYRMRADVIIPETGVHGILVSCGNRSVGFVWYIKDDYLVYENKANTSQQKIVSRIPLPRGNVAVEFEFIRDQAEKGRVAPGGIGRLYINDNLVGEQRLPFNNPFLEYHSSLYIGRGEGAMVSSAYEQPFTFTGTIKNIRVRIY